MLTALLWLAALAPAPAVRCAGLPPGEARYLIVGRNRPPASSGLPPLEYADDDARQMAALAHDRLCFSAEQITTLEGDEATRDAVLDALAAEKSKRLGRLFVYISAHGSHDEGVQLDAPLDWQTLHEAVHAVRAEQLFVFIDTCDSATFFEHLRGNVKGEAQIAPKLDRGRFYLTASDGRAYETHVQRGGEATGDVIELLHRDIGDERGVITSIHLCRALKSDDRRSLCQQQMDGGDGVVLVPEQRAAGYLVVDEADEPGVWSYVLSRVRAGETRSRFPIRTVDRGGSAPRRADGLPPGEYSIERIHLDRGRCDEARVRIEAGQTARVAASAWRVDPDNCARIRAREARVPARPDAAVALLVGVTTPWLERSTAAPVVRLEWYWSDVFGYRIGAGLRAERSLQGEPLGTDPARSAWAVGMLGFHDPLAVSFGWLDVFVGYELDVSGVRSLSKLVSDNAETKVRYGWTVSAAVRLGIVLRTEGALSPEFALQGGARIMESSQREMEAARFVGLVGGMSLGL